MVVLPYSVIRLQYYAGHHISTGANVAGACIFGLSGLFNVLLYFMTRRFEFDLGKEALVDDGEEEEEGMRLQGPVMRYAGSEGPPRL